MVNETDKSPQEEKQKARAIALLALALKQYSDKTGSDCPDEETIAAYCDGQLSDNERKQFRANILICPESYALWMAMERHRSEWQEVEQAADEKTGFRQRFFDWLVTPLHLTGGFAAVASVMLVVILLQTGGTSPELSDSYETAWMQPGLSFDYNNDTGGQIKGIPVFVNPALKAFREGAEHAQQAIKNKSFQASEHCLKSLEKCTTNSEMYHYIGSWAVLMNVSCQVESRELYSMQQVLLNRWYEQWRLKHHLSAEKSGLDSRIEQLYQLVQNSAIDKTEFCRVSDELLRFALRQ